MQYYPLIRHDAPTVPTVLIGTKLDLRSAASPQQDGGDISDANTFTYDEGVAMAKLIRAVGYVECSGKYDSESMKRALEFLTWVGVVHRVHKDSTAP
jgi:Ras family